MWKLFALLAILLIISGLLVVAVPRSADVAGGDTRGAMPEAVGTVNIVNQAREIAEQVNAPLSIVFGIVSLFYSRRSYIVNKERADAALKGRST